MRHRSEGGPAGILLLVPMFLYTGRSSICSTNMEMTSEVRQTPLVSAVRPSDVAVCGMHHGGQASAIAKTARKACFFLEKKCSCVFLEKSLESEQATPWNGGT